MKNKVELLSPAGTFEKMVVAFNYGADAVYLSGQRFGLRAFAGNFSDDELEKAVNYAHSINKKVYVTINIIAHDSDFQGLDEYLKKLSIFKVDGVIVADIGVAVFIKEHQSDLDIHISTQANVINSYSANFFAKLGVKRIVLARELSLNEIINIRKNLPREVELECFVHGAMCISYSGRCLLSNYLTGRDSNRGQCVQACRWEYTITEKGRQGDEYKIEEDDKGTYILNSKDMCLIEHIGKLIDAGIASFKIEGRMKSSYYVAVVTNAYRRAIDAVYNGRQIGIDLKEELLKASHRKYTTGFYFGEKDKECLESSYPVQSYEVMAVVLEDSKENFALIEQRNRFKKGDILQILSPSDNFNKEWTVGDMVDEQNEIVDDAKNVQQKLKIHCPFNLKKGDFLRKKNN